MAYQYYPVTAPSIQYGIPGPGSEMMVSPGEPTPSYATPGVPAGISGGVGPWFTSPQANPLYQLATTGAPNVSGPMGAMTGIAQGLQGAFKSNLDYANQALQLSFDPQQALFKQRQQDLIDATRAGEAARGIAMSPYGAGIEANAVGRFFNDWQNEQIARMAQGVQAATGLQSIWEQAQTAAAGIYNSEIQDMLQQYQISGDLMSKAMDEILQATQISANVALGQYTAAVGATKPISGGSGGGVSGQAGLDVPDIGRGFGQAGPLEQSGLQSGG